MKGSGEEPRSAYEKPEVQSGGAFSVEAGACTLFAVCTTAELGPTGGPADTLSTP